MFASVGIGAEAAQITPPLSSSQTNGVVSGLVRVATGPIPGAVVRVIGSEQFALTGEDGSFTLAGLPLSEPVDLSAWAPGYFVGGKSNTMPGQTNITIELTAHPTEDNPNYQWISALANRIQPLSCLHCMSSGKPGGSLPFEEWQRDAHGQSATNSRFLAMYNGTDVAGRKSPLTRYVINREYGRVPLRPDPSQPYYGPGYKLDFPDSAGNCAACHLPAAAANNAYQTDPNRATGVGREGVACDFCHKISNVRLDDSTGLPHRNAPGVLSYDFLRPPTEEQVFIGPYDDVLGHSIYSPLQNRSEFCAGCHFGVFWNVQVYNSFGEWLASPYADPQNGKTCQDCHMPHVGAKRIAKPPADSSRKAYPRDPQTIFSHAMPGASDEGLLQHTVTLKANAHVQGSNLVVRVTIINDRAGHHVPTDSPLRHLILLVSAKDGDGEPLKFQDGPTIPKWGGVGDPAKGYYAGLPGKAFAKVLEELWTEVSPTGAYWNPIREISDNRLPALGKDESRYTFAASADGKATVEVKLLFRRAFKSLMDEKGWEVPDVVMTQERIVLPQ
jgi:hypothetical protein